MRKSFEESIARALEVYWKYSSMSAIADRCGCECCKLLPGRSNSR